MLDEHHTWTLLDSLPRPLHLPSATVCGSELYVMPGYNDDNYSCSLSQVVASSYPNAMRSPPTLTWISMPLPPVSSSTIGSLCNKPLLIGGIDRNTGANSCAIYMLSQGQWVECGSLSIGRYRCLVASLSRNNNMVVVGGIVFPSRINRVELCRVNNE